MTREELIQRLHTLGWLPGWAPEAAISDVVLETAKSGYAAFHGIGVADVEQHMGQPRCALPDIMPMAERLCRWPDGNITVTIVDDLPPLSREQFKAAVMEACTYWAAVAGLRFAYVDDRSKARIVITAGPIDQSGGTLAWSELPCPARQLTQKYDTREKWIISANPSNGIDAVRVVCHELGHALGMGHISAGNLLAPTYSPQIRKPQAGDVAEMQSRYGKPTANPTPVPNPDGGTMSKFFDTLLKALVERLGPVLIEKFAPLILKWLEDWLRGAGPKTLADELTAIRVKLEAVAP